MKVAVCGLGRMGAAFAAALAADGHEVSAWNRTPKPESTAATPAEAVRDAEVVVVMVFDGPAADAVLLGPHGVASGACPGALVVNATTLAPHEARRLESGVRAAGLRYLEAPVLGSVPAVRKKALHVLTAGDEDDARAAEPVLLAWSREGSRRHTGPVGTAAGFKLIANLTLGTAMGALHDAVQLGAVLELPRTQVLDVLQMGPLGHVVGRKRERLDQDAYEDADFTVDGLVKDLTLAVSVVEDASAATGVLPMAEAAAGLAKRAAARGDGAGSLDLAVLARTPDLR
ncbi:NAD(P)-dependent oxidoreductase [Streptomyces sp. NPDC048057]|uniref:NAD(P)-dependent oxidoreductase n=1 Tax=Streptomyces sp. NPDC048057 TaxID=3155628 RepID=UPI0033C8D4FC